MTNLVKTSRGYVKYRVVSDIFTLILGLFFELISNLSRCFCPPKIAARFNVLKQTVSVRARLQMGLISGESKPGQNYTTLKRNFKWEKTTRNWDLRPVNIFIW